MGKAAAAENAKAAFFCLPISFLREVVYNRQEKPEAEPWGLFHIDCEGAFCQNTAKNERYCATTTIS